ncbi:MAG: DNA polymerase III subunit beta, partial [Bacteroidota bacterium]|nr:DNA polymerase III subunit beta [Bacteroidota bacterium]
MNFIVSSSLLLKHLQMVGGVINSSNTLPILDNFLFDIDINKLTISASDLETTMTATIDIKSEEKGTIAIPAKILIETLRTFSELPITFTINEETYGIEISAAEGKYKLTGQNGEDFPKIPEFEGNISFDIDSSLLSKGINKTIFATGSDEFRPIMAGIYCKIDPEGLIIVATDAHRLVKYIRTDIKVETATSFVLPRKPLNHLKNILAKEDCSVKVECNESNAFFTFGNVNLICRLLEGKYPNYEAVIPIENPNKLTIDRVAFLNAIKRTSIFSNQATHQVRLKLSGKELIISAEDIDFSNAANERMTCSYEGEDLEIGFNSKFLIEMLTNLDTDNILFEMSFPNRAGILLPIDGPSEESLLMLVMPVML